MNDVIFNEVKAALKAGTEVNDHPFRCFTLATMGVDQYARLRTVVLRSVSPALQLRFYTDKRSKKVLHIKESNKVSLLFYDPEESVQIRIEGRASIVSDHNEIEALWATVQVHSKKEYTKVSAPGSAIAHPDAIDYLGAENHFCMVDIEPFKIEYLKLQLPNHLKLRFWREDNTWNSEYLVP
ncbi:MAG: pyridoxamine 5'-phosphate oxidase family protein [Flavobacteriaceae bacterium]